MKSSSEKTDSTSPSLDLRCWYYSRAGPEARALGPVSGRGLLRLLERGVIKAEETMLFRHEGAEWQWLGASELKALASLVRRQWYATVGEAVAGPMNLGELRRRVEEGAIDGLTRVYVDDDWRAIAEVDGLRDLLAVQETSFEALENKEHVLLRGDDDDDDDDDLPVEEEDLPVEDDDEAREDQEEALGRSGRQRLPPKEEEEEEEGEGDDVASFNEKEKEKETKKDTPRAAAAAAAAAAAFGKERRKKKKRKSPPKNTWIYVEGLPADCSTEELVAHFRKCGVVAADPETSEPRVKIYEDERGIPKGDGSICYAHEASVQLAVDVLDGSVLRYGSWKPLKVSAADFAHVGDYDVSKRRKVNKTKAKIAKQAAEQLLDWQRDDDAPDDPGARKSGLRIIVVEGVGGGLEEADVLELFSQGRTLPEKITVFPGHPRRPAVVKLRTPAEAQAAVDTLNNVDGLDAHFWDGVTNYADERHHQTDDDARDEEEKRLDDFGDWLDNQELPPDLRPRVVAEE